MRIEPAFLFDLDGTLVAFGGPRSLVVAAAIQIGLSTQLASR